MGTCAVCGKSGADPTSFLSFLHGQDAKLAQCRHCQTGFGSGTAVCFECLEREKVPIEQTSSFSHTQGKVAVTRWQCPDCNNWNSENRRTFVEDLEQGGKSSRSREGGASSSSTDRSHSASGSGETMPEDMVETGARVNQETYDAEISVAETELQAAREAQERGNDETAAEECKKAISRYEKAKGLVEGESSMPDAEDTQNVDELLEEAESLLEEIQRNE